MPKNVANTTNFVSSLHAYNLRHFVKVWYSMKYFVSFFIITIVVWQIIHAAVIVLTFSILTCTLTRNWMVLLSHWHFCTLVKPSHSCHQSSYFFTVYTHNWAREMQIYHFFILTSHVCNHLIILRSSHTWSDIDHSMSEKTEFCYKCLLSYT